MAFLVSDHQYDMLKLLVERPAAAIARYDDTSVSTLIAMANRRRQWVELHWSWSIDPTTRKRTRRIISAGLLPAGLSAYERGTQEREERARRDAARELVAAGAGRRGAAATMATADLFRLYAADTGPDLPF